MASFKNMLILFWILLHSPSKISVVTDIPENINELCPYTSICNQTANSELNTTGMQPCCHQCSCDRLCGLRLDCCFEEYDSFKLVPKGLVDCIEPVEGDSELSDVHSAYYMIKACNFAAESVGELCKTHDIHGNSLIAPVSSTYTGYIYVNEECAKCNGLELFTKWEALFFYNARKYFTSFRVDFAESLNNKISTLLFKPPAGEDWHNLQCFKKYVTDFAEFKCELNEYLDMCENLYAPYTSFNGVVYKNVYCKICEDKNSMIQLDCEDDDAVRNLLTNFGMLMDMKEVNALRQNNRNERVPSIIGQECNDDNTTLVQKDCLKLYCPEGQIETPKGCAYLGQWWYSIFFNLQVKLTPSGSNKLPLSTLLRLNQTEKNNPFSWIRSPCRDAKLNLISVYNKRSDNNTEKEYVESLLVVVGRNTGSSNGFDPSIILPMMKLCVDKTWTLTINSKPYLFKATFDDYMRYVQDGVQRLAKYSINNGNFIEENTPKPAIYDVLLSTETPMSYQDYRRLDRIGIWLRKSYFCKQVQIPVDDIETDYGTITILSKNITIGNNKYTKNYYFHDRNGELDYKKSTFSVCLDDYMSHKTSNSGCFMGMASSYTCMMFLHVIVRTIIHVQRTLFKLVD